MHRVMFSILMFFALLLALVFGRQAEPVPLDPVIENTIRGTFFFILILVGGTGLMAEWYGRNDKQPPGKSL